jgi:hypothetical protein
MYQYRILTCKSFALISLDGDHNLGARHLHRGVGIVDDRHKFQEERTPEDAVVPVVKTGYLEH